VDIATGSIAKNTNLPYQDRLAYASYRSLHELNTRT